MYETIRYTKPFLSQVIVRVDFVAPLAAPNVVLPPRLANDLSSRFPIIEPSESISVELKFGAKQTPQHRETHYPQLNLFGVEREEQVLLSALALILTYRKYKTFGSLKDDFTFLVETLKKQYPDIKVSRLGLRYVNQISMDDLPAPNSWESYIDPQFSSVSPLFPKERLARLMHVADLKYEEVNLHFQFGMPNPDFPAVIRRPFFVLDFDGYVRTAHELSESMGYLAQAHEAIQGLFEKAITQQLREKMIVRPESAI